MRSVTHRGARRWRIVNVVALACVAIGVGGSVAGAARGAVADDGRPAYGVAAADGVRVGLLARDYVVADRLVDVGAPSAQASIEPLGSTGYAAYPYPGELILSGPGLVAGGTGIPVDDYPLIAQSRDPAAPEASVEHGPYRLRAESDATSSAAVAAAEAVRSDTVAIGSTVATARAALDADDTMTSRSTIEAEVISVADVLRIGRVEAEAKVVAASDGPAETTSDFAVQGASVAGQPVTITEDGLALPGTEAPLPAADPLAAILAEAGIELRYLAPETTTDGVVSGGLVITMPVVLPNAAEPGLLTLQLGRASARAHGGRLASDAGPRPAATTPDAAELPPAPASAAPGASSPADATLTEAGGAGGPRPSTAERAPGAPRPAASARPVTPLSDTVSGTLSETSLFYLVLAVGGLAAFVAIQLLRYFAVRLAWT